MNALTAAAGALVLGAVSCWCAVMLGLVARRLRNNALIARGEPPYRDVAFSKDLVILGAIVAALVGLGLGFLTSTLRAAIIGGLAPAIALLGTQIITAVIQAWH